ncbi:hypothetical protein ACFWBS_59710 [Streptomyces mirabilis]|uniref:hypothetical protein n=1 Tax=Streptomyces mirabilis TaxID=68239 RepID=UPI0036687FE2
MYGVSLKVFTQRVEQHRNEQRRRQQQLDQPADQATPSSQPPEACPRLTPAVGFLCGRTVLAPAVRRSRPQGRKRASAAST